MNMRIRIFVFAWLLLLSVSMPTFGFAAGGSIGFRLFVQPWILATDSDNPIKVIDDPTMISKAFSEGWVKWQPTATNELAKIIGAQKIADGVNLYNIRFGLTEPVLTLVKASGGGTEPLRVRATLLMRQVSFVATATTPTPLPSSTDPRCSAKIDVTASVNLTIDAKSATPISADDPKSTSVAIENFSWDSQNFPCDVIKAGVGLLGFENTIRRQVENPAIVRPMAASLTSAVNKALGPVNAQVTRVVPSNLSRVNAWLARGPEAQVVAVYAGLQAPVPDNSPRATIKGTIRTRDGSPVSINCEKMPFVVTRKSGPRPVINASGDMGEFPTEPVAISISCGPMASDGSQRFRMTGLSSTFPQFFTNKGLVVPCGKSGVRYETAWSGMPTTFSSEHDIKVYSVGALPCRVDSILVIPDHPPGPIDIPRPDIQLRVPLQ
jgi:hypothetical protein